MVLTGDAVSYETFPVPEKLIPPFEKETPILPTLSEVFDNIQFIQESLEGVL